LNLKIGAVGPALSPKSLKPGEVQITGKRIFVGTLDSPLEILRITPAGKKEMATTDWLNGARVVDGDFFE
jgi:methionyl-tRNA formyltransferase